MRGPITKDSIRELFAMLDKEVGGGLELLEGNSTAGRSWRLMVGDNGEHPFLGLDNGFIGWTRREAFRTLEGVLAGWLAATRHWGLRLQTDWEDRPQPGTLTGVVNEMLPPTEF